MQTSSSGSTHPTLLTGRRDPRLAAERSALVRDLGEEVRRGTYAPPMDGVVESLVVALLPHIRARA